MFTFDLVNEPWVPVMRGGRRMDVSLREALLEAHAIEALAVDDPLESVALLRQVLLPVLLDSVGPPRTEEAWEELWLAERLDALTITTYLEKHADRFDLFHVQQPFAQVAGLRTSKAETKPIGVLMASIPAGNNVPLFGARTEANPPFLSAAQAVRALLAAQCWDTAAIKSGAVGDGKASAGKTTGNPTGPLGQLGVVIPIGATLKQTLLLNLPILPQGRVLAGRPQWLRSPATPEWTTRVAEGELDLLTWQSRRIRLIPETGCEGQVSVGSVVLCAGDRLAALSPDMERHTAWKQVDNPKAGQPPSRPVRHQPGKAAWEGLDALLATGSGGDKHTAPGYLRQAGRLKADGCLPEDLPLQVLIVGVQYGNQSAVIEDVMLDSIPLPVMALVPDTAVHDLLCQITAQAGELRRAANALGDDVRAAVGAGKVPWDKSQRLGDLLIHALAPSVRRILAGLQQQPEKAEQAEQAWIVQARRVAWSIAEPVLNATPDTAFLGRDPQKRFAPRLSTAEANFRRSLKQILDPTSVGQGPSNPQENRR